MPVYEKFTHEQVFMLKQILFTSNKYPSKIKIKSIAQKLNKSIAKIENWFKYNRRKLFLKQKFDCGEYKVRNPYTPDESKFLKEMYLKDPNPSYKTCIFIAQTLNSRTAKQVKNWFSNQRRKEKGKKEMLLNLDTSYQSLYVEDKSEVGEILSMFDPSKVTNFVWENTEINSNCSNHPTEETNIFRNITYKYGFQ